MGLAFKGQADRGAVFNVELHGPRFRFALIGVPGPLMVWVSLLLRRLVIEEFGENFDGVVLDSDETTESFLSGEKSEHVFIISHFPRRELIDWLQREQIPVVVILDDAIKCVAWQMCGLGTGYLEAVRPVTQSLSLIQKANELKLRGTVSAKNLDINILSFSDHLARIVFGRPLFDIAALLAAGGYDPRFTIRQSIAANPEISGHTADIPADQHQLLRDVCDPMMAMVNGETDVEIIWRVALFYDGSSLRQPAPIALDLVGPARCLYYGPYLHLPVGQYEGVLMVGLSEEIRSTILRAEIYMGRPIASFIANATSGGYYHLPLEIDIADSRDPIEIRIFIDQGEIEGRIAFALVRILPQFGRSAA